MVYNLNNEPALIYRLSEHVPDVIRQVLTERGWIEYDDSDPCTSESEWNLWWRTQRFRKSEHAEIEAWQRINHFPQTDAITRKDCLVRNLRRLRCIHGSQVFNFHPHSYILPNEYTKFVADYGKELRLHGKDKMFWICKPSVLSRGRGIFVFKELKDLNYDCSVIVQRYIPKPLLMSGYKFDLRIYVCVPSFHPLTIYIYQEGLVRFSTEKFNLEELGNVFSHLTNTSINKYGPAFSVEKERVGSGCKWTLAKLRTFFNQMEDLDEMVLWQKISNIVTLVLATQAPYVPRSQNCFEIFGFDILIDEFFKPWLLEVNFSPALSMDCQADYIVKRQLINDLIDLLNFKDSDAARNQVPKVQDPRNLRRSSLYASSSSDCHRDLNHNISKSFTYGQKSNTLPRSKTAQEKTNLQYFKMPRPQKVIGQPVKPTTKKDANNVLSSSMLPGINKAKSETKRENFESNVSSRENACKSSSTHSDTSTCNGEEAEECLNESKEQNSIEDLKPNKSAKYAWTVPESRSKSRRENTPSTKLSNRNFVTNTRKNSRSPGYKSLPQINHSNLSSFFKNSQTKEKSKYNMNNPEPLNLDSIAEDDDVEINDGTARRNKEYFLFGNKQSRRKKTANSAPVSRSPVQYLINQQSVQSARSYKQKPKKYVSPYSTRSTSKTYINEMSDSHWPRTRVGDFILTFPWNDTTKKAAMCSEIDIRVVIREQQKFMKKLVTLNSNETMKNRRASQTLSTADALELSFEMKFDNTEKNPLYFWGPKNPPLLSTITG